MSAVIEERWAERLQHSSNWSWQQVSSNTIEDITVLAELLQLDGNALTKISAGSEFKLRVPLTFVSRMQAGDLNDPLLLQILPQKKEHQLAPGFSHDPLDEQRYNVSPGLVHKYRGRVLLTAAVSCPINCRYCFRRHFPYDQNRLSQDSLNTALDYIRDDNSIREVILSGGEPLLLNDRKFAQLLDKIESVPHVKQIRIHTRFPVAVPQRLTKALCERLIDSRAQVAVVLHANHPNEIDQQLKHHLAPLNNSSVTLLNQSVLLDGINNQSATLCKLSEKLYEAGVLPYYLHATDPVSGTAHFRVDDNQARDLVHEMTNQLPGYLVPTLVREISGRPAKTRL